MLQCRMTRTGRIRAAFERPSMSQQLTLSSLFCVLALAGLCVVTGARDLAGYHAPALAERAELASGPLVG